MTREDLKSKFYEALVMDYFPAWNNLSVEEVNGLSNIAGKVAEPLFEEIGKLEDDIDDLRFCEECTEMQEKLKENNCYPPMFCILCWNKRTTEMGEEIQLLKEDVAGKQLIIYNLSDTCRELHPTISNLRAQLSIKESYIKALEHDLKVTSDLSTMRQNEISGLQSILGEKDAEIGRLQKNLTRESERFEEVWEQLRIDQTKLETYKRFHSKVACPGMDGGCYICEMEVMDTV